MRNDVALEHGSSLEMLASVLAGRAVAVANGEPDAPPWTDGETVYLDPQLPAGRRLAQVSVQASLIAAGSLDPDILGALVRKPRPARRYLALEARRALRENAYLLPPAVAAAWTGGDGAPVTDSPAQSLAIARSDLEFDTAAADFGELRPKAVLAAARRAAATPIGRDGSGHVPRRPVPEELEELDDGELDAGDTPDLFTSPVGGGGAIGKWLKKLLSSTRGTGDGGGPPGADSPTHRTNAANRGGRAVLSTASSGDIRDVAPTPGKFVYPEWDGTRKRYRPDWCTVHETVPVISPAASGTIDDALSVARPLARLGLGLQRRRRQAQGDDIDIDAAVEERLEVRAGSIPGEAVYLDTVRRRRDLSVLLLLDVSGSAAEPGSLGRTVHQQQRTVAAALMVALHDLGDRVALYAYSSQGRGAVNMLPVKHFGDPLGAQVSRRLNSLEPGGYSRLGAAIRHGAAVLDAEGGTARRLLVVLSDGLAYDHGYERDYGAADARRALSEARRRGTGCVCLTVGANTEAAALRAVFGSAAHATVGRPDQLPALIGPMFRSAIRLASERTGVRRGVPLKAGHTGYPRFHGVSS